MYQNEQEDEFRNQAEQLFNQRKIPGTIMGILVIIFMCGGYWLEFTNQTGAGTYIWLGMGLALLTEIVILYFILQAEKQKILSIEAQYPRFKEYYKAWVLRKMKENLKLSFKILGGITLFALKIIAINSKKRD